MAAKYPIPFDLETGDIAWPLELEYHAALLKRWKRAELIAAEVEAMALVAAEMSLQDPFDGADHPVTVLQPPPSPS